jgi:Peptidase family M28
MRATDTVAGLTAFEQRGAGTDAERRAGRWLARQLQAGNRSTQTETFWCRPNWALAHAWHAALGLAGSLVSVGSPHVGGALILLALVSAVADSLAGVSLGRRLTLERASQNVIGTRSDADPNAVRLILTANYDAGRTGLAYRRALRAVPARMHRALGQRAPGWLAWLALALVWLLAIAILRLVGHRGAIIGAAQLPPTVGLVLALALLIDLASAGYGPAASDNASGVAVALALAGALDVAPPRRLAVHIVLTGAGDAQGIGLRHYLKANRRTLNTTNTVVLGIAACGAGQPRWWVSDGALVPLRYLGRLGDLCTKLAAGQPQLHAAAHRGRGSAPALAARAARRPAISIGCLDERGLAPRSHQASDTPAAVDPSALDATIQFGLMLVDEIDAYVRDRKPQAGRRSHPANPAVEGAVAR